MAEATEAGEETQPKSKLALPGAQRGPTTYLMEPEKLVIIGLDTEHKEGMHWLYDERIKLPLLEVFVQDVMLMGVLEPVIVAKDGEDVLIVNGRQRVRAAREVNKRLKQQGQPPMRVPCIYKRGDTEDHLAITISTNEHRINDPVMIKAKKLSRLIETGRTMDEAKIIFGVDSKATLEGWIKLLELAPQVKKAVEEEMISASAAIQLHGLKHEEQVEKLAELLKEYKENGGPKPGAAKAKAKAKGRSLAPSKRKISKILEFEIPDTYRAILEWVSGKRSDDWLVKNLGGKVAEAIEALAQKKKQ